MHRRPPSRRFFCTNTTKSIALAISEWLTSKSIWSYIAA